MSLASSPSPLVLYGPSPELAALVTALHAVERAAKEEIDDPREMEALTKVALDAECKFFEALTGGDNVLSEDAFAKLYLEAQARENARPYRWYEDDRVAERYP